MLHNKKIFLLGLSILGILVIGFAFFALKDNNKIPDHCYNSVLDHGEEGVDCGSICNNKCQEFDNLNVKWVKVTSFPSKEKYFVALIENPNPLYGISNFNYHFQGKRDDEIIAEAGDSAFILPQESKYLFQKISKESNKFQDLEINFTNNLWEKFFSYKEPDLFIIHQKVQEINAGGFNFQASGRLINDSVYNLRKVIIKVVLFDQNSNPLVVNKTYLSNIKAEERRDFKVFWKEDISQHQVSKLEMTAETNIFEDSNFVKDYNYERVDVRY
jgi:hypothetical protein